MRKMFRLSVLVMMTAVCIAIGFTQSAMAESAAQIDLGVDEALKKLYDSTPAALELSKIAKGILVFPSIVKGGLVVAGQYGEGALRKEGKTAGYYNSVAASYGLQAGVQKFGYALFFLDAASLEYLNKSEGWELGVGPSITIVDAGIARSLSTTTAKDAVYAFFFDQKGLMAGLGIQGSKITQITPK